MKVEHALYVLKDERKWLENKLDDMKALEAIGEKISERMKTRYIHQKGSLDFAIEVLEEYLD